MIHYITYREQVVYLARLDADLVRVDVFKHENEGLTIDPLGI